MEFQLLLIACIPQCLLIFILLNYINFSQQESLSEIQKLSANMYDQVMGMVELQNNATMSLLFTNMEHQIVVLTTQRRMIQNIMEGGIVINSKFRRPVLNIQNTYNQNEDPYLLNLYKNNASYLISSWHQKDTLVESNLNQLSKDQLRNSSIVDFIQRASLYANRKQNKSNKTIKMTVKSYFQVFSSDGMFFGTGANMTYQNFTDGPPCFQSKYHLDSRCQEFYQAQLLKPKLVMAGYPPTKFNYSDNNQPFIAMGLCKKIQTPTSFHQFYQDFLSTNTTIFSITCNSIYLEQSYLNFQKLGNNYALTIIIDYKQYKVAYQSDFQIKPNTIYTLQETYLSKLDLNQQQYFLAQLQNFAKNISTICSTNKYDIFQVGQQQKSYNFQFMQGNQQMIVLYQQQLNINNHNIYGIDIVLSYIAELENKIAKMINDSIIHLTNILKQLTIDDEKKNIILFEDGLFNYDYQIDYSLIFQSSDMHLLYQSFQNLFQTLIITTQNIFGNNESQSLIELTQQISYFNIFKNYKAQGIIYNNIGNLHFNNRRYIEALENYSQSIICCKYEMNEYAEDAQRHNQNFKNIKQQNSRLSSINQHQNINNKIQNKSNNFDKDKEKNIFISKLFDKLKSSFSSKNKQMQIKNKIKQEELMLNLKHEEEFQKFKEEQEEFEMMLLNRKYNFLLALVFYNIKNQNKITLWDQANEIVSELQNQIQQQQSSLKLKNLKLKMGIILNCIQTFYSQFNGITSNLEEKIQYSTLLFNQIQNQSIKDQLIQQQNQINSQSPNNIYNQENFIANNSNFADQYNKNKSSFKEKYNLNLFSPSNNKTKKDQMFYLQDFNYSPKLIQSNKQNLFIQVNNKGKGFIQQQSYSNQQDVQNINSKSSNRSKNHSQVSQKRKETKNKINNFQQLICESPNYKQKKQKNSPNNQKVQIKQNKDFNEINCNRYKNSSTEQNIPQINLKIQEKQNIVQKYKFDDDSSKNSQKNNNQVRCKQISTISQKRQIEKLQIKINENENNNQQFIRVKTINNQINQQLKKQNSQDICNDKIIYNNQIPENIEEDINSQKINFKDITQNQKDKQQILDSQTSSNEILFKDSQKSYLSNYKSFLMYRRSTYVNSNGLSKQLYVDGFGEDKNQYEIKDNMIFGYMQDQIATMFFIQNKFYKAAETITQTYENNQLNIPFLLNRSFKILLSIFTKYGLSHPVFDKIYEMLNSDILFQINLIYFDWEDSNFCVNSQIKSQELGEIQIQKEKTINLCLDIVEQVTKKQEDYFGFIYSSLADMQIRKKICMINHLDQKKKLIVQEIIDCFAPILKNQNSDYRLGQQSIKKDQDLNESKDSLKNFKTENQFQQTTKWNQLTPIKNEIKNFNSHFISIIKEPLQNQDIESMKQNETTQNNNQEQKYAQINTQISNDYESKINDLSPTKQNFCELNDNTQNQFLYETSELNNFVIQDQTQNKIIQNKQLNSNINNQQFNKHQTQSLINSTAVYQLNKQNQQLSKFSFNNQQINYEFQDIQDDIKLQNIQFSKEKISKTNQKKRELFYQSIRKAIFEILGKQDTQQIMFYLHKINFQQQNQKEKQLVQNHLWNDKNEFMNNLIENTQLQKKNYKKVIIAITSDVSMINERNKEFSMLEDNLQYLQIELCILIKDDSLSTNESNIPKQNQKSPIFYFFSEQNLLRYLINSRCSQYHSQHPLIVEHF
ncbi:hypothetical protein ABPG74_020451 [Tetrahymena malaccensis]